LTLVVLALVGSALMPIPIEWTVAVLAILCLAIFLVALVSHLRAVAGVALILALAVGINFAKLHGLGTAALRPSASADTLQQQFKSWLAHTKIPGGSSGSAGLVGTAGPAACGAKYVGTSLPYPVYIIAVEGGGIYAASAASMLLARLQDRAPCFAQHVFAISAVSGGAIGATIFQAVEQSPPAAASAAPAPLAPAAASPTSADSSKGCVPPSAAGGQQAANHSLELEVCAIIQDDHFSPLVASIFPELLGVTRSGRAPELAESFDDSVKARDPAAGQILDTPFDTFAANWAKDSTAPALVLNSTWVETGYRAAFAPFPLHAHDGSLYSFVDKDMPDDESLTLIKAAVVSARFPAVLPPYSLLIEKEKGSPDRSSGQSTDQPAADSTGTVRWNFVDGGYSDTSGAATALALYNALKGTAKQEGVDLRVILLTSSDPQLQPNNIDGTEFTDTLGPIEAMLSVRDGLGNEAVARACNSILAASAIDKNGCEDPKDNPDPSLQIVGVEDQNYGLSLGWKISQTTFGVVSWMLGEPEFVDTLCANRTPKAAANDKDATVSAAKPSPQANGQFELNEEVVCANSRVQLGILKALGDWPPQQNP
jgi:hypothetical protein